MDVSFDRDVSTNCQAFPCLYMFKIYSPNFYHPHFNGYYVTHFGKTFFFLSRTRLRTPCLSLCVEHYEADFLKSG